MPNPGRCLTAIVILLWALVAAAIGQDQRSVEPQVAATGPVFDLNAGPIFHTMLIPGSDRASLYGITGGVDRELSNRWAATEESSYIRTSNVNGTGSGGNVMSFLLGPTFCTLQDHNTRLFLHGLGGVAFTDRILDIGDAHPRDWATRFSYMMGGGVEQSFSRHFAVRLNADYVAKPYSGSSDVVASVNLVFSLQPRIH